MSRLLLPLLALWALWVAPAWGQERFRVTPPWGKGPVEIRADELTAAEGGGRLEARGHAAVSWGGARLRADRITYLPDEARAEAEGKVVLEDEDGNVLECARLRMELASQTGEVEEGTLWLARGGYRVWGKRFRKTGPVTYRVEDGGFTTCDGTWPSWTVEARRVDVELEGFLVARGAVFWWDRLPLLYTPWVAFPVKVERQSGLLPPRVGFTERDGYFLGLRYFWAFADWADLTYLLDYRSRRGWTHGAELRYVLADDHEGRVKATFLRDRRSRSDRYTVEADHRSRFRDGSRARLHVDYVGDENLFQDLGDTLEERGVERLESYLVGTREAGAGTWFGVFDYFEVVQGAQDPTRQRLPSLGLAGRETPWLGPLLWEPTVELTRFYRREGPEGERLVMAPSLGADLGTQGLGAAARLGYRQHVYRVDGETRARGAARAEAVGGVSLWRPYGAWLHTLEPSVRLVWEEGGRGGAPPGFDFADAFGRRVQTDFLLENRWLRRQDYSELAGADLEGSFDWDDGEWEPLRGELFLKPTPAVELRADGVVDPEGDPFWVRGAAAGEIRDRRGDRAFLGYRYWRGQAEYADGGVELALVRGVSVQYRRRHSFRDERMLEEGYGLHLQHPCWELLMTLSRNWDADRGAYEYRFYTTLDLEGLSRLGSRRGLLP